MRFPYQAYPVRGIGKSHVAVVYRPVIPVWVRLMPRDRYSGASSVQARLLGGTGFQPVRYGAVRHGLEARATQTTPPEKGHERRVIGPAGDAFGLIDTGADDTMLPDRFLAPLGVATGAGDPDTPRTRRDAR
jgi:hypothetical protein